MTPKQARLRICQLTAQKGWLDDPAVEAELKLLRPLIGGRNGTSYQKIVIPLEVQNAIIADRENGMGYKPLMKKYKYSFETIKRVLQGVYAECTT